MFGAFLGDGKSPGFLGRADQDLRASVLSSLDSRIREWAAGAAYLALRPERPWKEVVYDWQPYLNRGLFDTTVMIVGEQTAALTSWVSKRKVTVREIEDVLVARTSYLDQHRWCKDLALALRLPGIELKTIDNKYVPLRISLRGVTDPLSDPRVVEAAMRAMRFRRADAIGIEAGDCTAVLRPGHQAWAKTGTGRGAATLSSDVIITAERLTAVESQGGALSELLGLQSEVA